MLKLLSRISYGEKGKLFASDLKRNDLGSLPYKKRVYSKIPVYYFKLCRSP
jgi:hypothetical protein